MEVCYRHPNRETGVSCSNCGRPICPDCMTSTSVGMRCPECARQGRTRVRTMSVAHRRAHPHVDPDRDQRPRRDRLDLRRAGGRPWDAHGRRRALTRHDRERRLLDAPHERLPPRRPFPPLLEHAGAVDPRHAARASPGTPALRARLLRVAVLRLARGADRVAGAVGRRLGRRVRAHGRGGDRRSASRPQPPGERSRPLARNQPADHVHDPEHLDRSAHRRADRRLRRPR